MKFPTSRTLLIVLCLMASGCGGDNSAYLPKPRPPEIEPSPAASAGAAPASPAKVTSDPGAAVVQPADAFPTQAPSGDKASPAQPPAANPGELTESDRRRRVIDQLTRIGAGFEAYRQKHRSYPDRLVGAGRLSWRVGLLSYLGQKDLLELGDDGWPWDHPANRTWMQRTPEPFRTDGGNDGRTTLVLMIGVETAFATDRAPRPEDFSDSLECTILAVEIDGTFAVPWTAPQDYEFKRDTVQAALFGRHKDCCYALFGGKTGVRRIPADISDGDLLALLTPGGGKTAASLAATQPPTVEVDERLIRKLDQQPLARFVSGEAREQNASTSVVPADIAPTEPARQKPDVMVGSEDAESRIPPSPVNRGAAFALRQPVPDAAACERARQTLREIYRDEYAQARTTDEKRDLADKLLARARTLDADPVGRYMALELGRKIATEAGAIPMALDAADLMQNDFEVDVLRDKGQVLAASVGLRLSESDDERVLREARSLIGETLRQEEFDLAERIQAAGLSAARRLKDLAATAEFAERRQEIAWARAARKEALQFLETLAVAPQDAKACHSVGVYYCLVKQRWEDGLVMLARSPDDRLAELAAQELKRPAAPAEQAALADGWWRLAEAESNRWQSTGMRSRAAYWYEQALPALPPGIERVKAEARIRRAAEQVSKSVIGVKVRGAEPPDAAG